MNYANTKKNRNYPVESSKPWTFFTPLLIWPKSSFTLSQLHIGTVQVHSASVIIKFGFADGANCFGFVPWTVRHLFKVKLPSSIPVLSSLGSRGSAGAYPSRLRAKGRGTPWTGRQSITGPHADKQPLTPTFTPTGNLEPPINLTCMFLDCGRKPEYPEETHASTGRTCKLHTERPQPRFEPGTF